MGNTNLKSASSRARTFAQSASIIAISTSLFIGVSAASAQTAPAAEPQPETVVVTGIRRGIIDSISAKKRSSQIVEAVSAEDIGKLPDQSIAESIARLPGIAAQRTNGRASALSIRGLGPDYTVTTLNGREQVSTNDNRSVEFDQYPSELISQVLVYKTPNAEMMSQGIAGTADLRTVRPIAYGKRAIALGYRREQNSEDAVIGGMTNTGDRYTFTYINQFADKTIGVALGYAHTSSPYQSFRKEAYGYPTAGSTVLPADANKLVIGGEKDGIQSSSLERDGYMAVIEFKPNDRFHATIDGYHSDFTELQRIARLEANLYSPWGGGTLQPGYTSSADRITGGTVTGVNVVVENYVNERAASVDSIGFNSEYKVNENWTLGADISRQQVSRSDLIVESTAGTGAAGTGPKDTVKFTTTPDGFTQLTNTLDYSNFNTIFLTDPGGWGGPVNRAGFVKAPDVEDELTAIKLSAMRKLETPIFKSVSFGVNRTTRTKNKVGKEGFMSLNGTSNAVVVPTAYRTGTTNAAFLGSAGGMIAYDALALWKDGFFKFTQDTCNACLAKSWKVSETVDTYFLKADIDSTFQSIPVTGNIGLQVVNADQESVTNFVANGAVSPVVDGTSYTDVLPTMALNFAVADDVTVRLGIGKTLARPRMDDMAGGVSYGSNTNGNPSVNAGKSYYWTGGGGNAKLKPWKATAYDLSVEKYFGRKGYVSAAFFYKTLDSFIFGNNVERDFTGVALTGACATAGAATDTTAAGCSNANTNRIGLIGGQSNGKGGHISGAEISLSVPGEMVTPILDGFGLIVSAAFNESSIDPRGTGEIDVPGLSRSVINTTLFYEKHGFSARVSQRSRGEFLGEVPDYTNTLENKWVHGEKIIDAQLGYEFQEGPIKGLSINLTGTNLTNEPFFTYDGKGNPDKILKYEKYGATYMFGISYKF